MTSYFPRMTVVGVVADSRLNALDKEVYPEVFWPMAQLPSAGGWVTLRTAADPVGLARAAQTAMRELDPDIAIGEVTTMRDVVQGSLWRQRLTAVLLATFAGLALALAAAGIYGVFSYLVNRRTKELGVRVALGASKAQILSLVLGSSLKLAVMGIAMGTAAALVAGRLMSSWLYGVQANDALTFASVAVLLLLTALAACYFPAARAARVDPVIALRDE